MIAQRPRRKALIVGLLASVLAACTASESISFPDGSTPATTGAAGTTGTAGSGGPGAAGSGGPGVAGSSGAAGSSVSGSGGRGGSGAAGSAVAGAGGNKMDAGASDRSTGAAGGAGAGVGGGGGSAMPSDAGVPLTYTNFIESMLVNSCGGCHFITTSIGVKGNFGISYANLMSSVNAEHANCPNLDATKKRVVPGKPDNSLIYIKVSVANPPGACGGHMPANGVNMGPQQIAALKDWITQGAKQ